MLRIDWPWIHSSHGKASRASFWAKSWRSKSDRDGSCRCKSRSSDRCGKGFVPAGLARNAAALTRGLASGWHSRGVVTEAYGQLSAEGYLQTRQGAAVRVSTTVRVSTPRVPAPRCSRARPMTFTLAPRLGWLSPRPLLRSLRAAWREGPLDRWVTSIRGECRSCAKRSRATWRVFAVWQPSPSTCCMHRLYAGSPCCAGAAPQGVQRIALEDPLACAPIDRRAGRVQIAPVP